MSSYFLGLHLRDLFRICKCVRIYFGYSDLAGVHTHPLIREYPSLLHLFVLIKKRLSRYQVLDFSSWIQHLQTRDQTRIQVFTSCKWQKENVPKHLPPPLSPPPHYHDYHILYLIAIKLKAQCLRSRVK